MDGLRQVREQRDVRLPAGVSFPVAGSANGSAVNERLGLGSAFRTTRHRQGYMHLSDQTDKYLPRRYLREIAYPQGFGKRVSSGKLSWFFIDMNSAPTSQGVPMIRLTRLNHVPMILNADLIEHIDMTPDTVVTLTSGQKFMVLETAEEVVDKVIVFRQKLLSPDPARLTAMREHGSESESRSR
jgi:flagellar protein FlbD